MASEHKEYDYGTVLQGESWDFLSNQTQYRAAQVGERKTLDGHVGNRTVVNPLSIWTYHRVVPTFSGELKAFTGQVVRRVQHCPVGNWYNVHTPISTSLVPAFTNADQVELAWEILARTNPSAPTVGVPQFGAELRDLPDLVRGWGQSLIRNAAKANLSWQWAIAPAISDLWKLINFAELMEHKFNELRKLQDRKCIRKRCLLDSGEWQSGKTTEYCESAFAAITAKRSSVTTWKTWGSAEWKLLPDSPIIGATYVPLRKLAGHVLTGITTHGALETAWELLPWTWLIDWFSNVGTMIKATNNTLRLTWGRLALMRTSRCTTIYELDKSATSSWITIDGWYDAWVEHKERLPVYPAIPFPLPSLPVVSARKWSILLSLAALRR